MRDYKVEFEKRVEFIRSRLAAAHAKGIVFGNSGGKDSALVGILCKAACDNTVGIIMREAELAALEGVTELTDMAVANIAPRLRMVTLYAIAHAEGRIVAGTGNASEAYVGYFTKWGDGAHDFNPIADLTVTEIYEFLEYLHAPRAIIEKAPSAGLFEGQTDEAEMGITYAAIDAYISGRPVSDHDRAVIERMHANSEHKRTPIASYKG